MLVFIINWLPDNQDLRQKRLIAHRNQLNEWVTNTDLTLNVLSMNYTESDRTLHDRIIYHDRESMKLPKARNEVLRMFYTSKEKWIMMLDDDVCVNDYTFINEMQKNIDAYDSIDCFTAIRADHTFKQTKEHYFTRTIFPNQIWFIRNFALTNDKLMWGDETFNEMEDKKFGIDLIANKYNVYRCHCMQIKLLIGYEHSTFGPSLSFRKKEGHVNNFRIYNQYKDIGMFINERTSKLSYDKFFENCWTSPINVTIKSDNTFSDLFKF